MIQSFLKRAANDEPVYLPDIRKAFQENGSRPFHIRLALYDGTEKEYPLLLPETHSAEEEAFLRSYLYAVIYNMLSAAGAVSLTFFIDSGDAGLTRIAREIPAVFQSELPLSKRNGYGKCLNVNERVLRTFFGEGTKLSFRIRDLSEKSILQESCAGKSGFSLKRTGSDLSSLPEKTKGKTLLGIDIGGTDIKFLISVNGSLHSGQEYDWNPAAFRYASELIDTLCSLVEQMKMKFDGIGISFPDVVIQNRIVGGETAKTKGIRENPSCSYEQQFSQISDLCERLKPYIHEGGRIACINDGNMAAFTSAVETAAAGEAFPQGLICHSLGTDLGTGFVYMDGTFPQMPLELYNFLIDLGSFPQGNYPSTDARSTRNVNTELPGSLQRCASQTAAFRLAAKALPLQAPGLYRECLAAGYLVKIPPQSRSDTEERTHAAVSLSHPDGAPESACLTVPVTPEDMRKPFLEYLMQQAEQETGSSPAPCTEIFRQIGEALAAAFEETEFLLQPAAKARTLYGRLVKQPACFRAICEGAHRRVPGLILTAADDGIANTPLMKQLAVHPSWTIAQFGQAVGAIHFACL